MSENNLNDDVKVINNIRDKISDTVATDKSNLNNLTDHEFKLFDDICNIISKILTNESTQKVYKSLETKIGSDISKELVELISTTVSYATYYAIASHGTKVGEVLSENFKATGDVIQIMYSDINVLQLKVGDIEKKMALSKFEDINK